LVFFKAEENNSGMLPFVHGDATPISEASILHGKISELIFHLNLRFIV